MKLKTLKEDAAAGSVTTASIASTVATPVSGQSLLVTRRLAGYKPVVMPKTKKPVIRSKRTGKSIHESALVKFDTKTALLYRIDSVIFEDPTDRKTDAVMSLVNTKIDHAQKQHEMSTEKSQYHTSTFGLEDADGNVVKVTVKREQSEEFEKRLNDLLSTSIDKPKEIAELLYMLKDDFDILDVDWAQQITEDDPTPTKTDKNDPTDPDSDPDEVGGSTGEDNEEPPSTDMKFDPDLESDIPLDAKAAQTMQNSTVTLLQQVVDLLKKETEARASEAELTATKNRAATQDVNAKAEQQELERQIELANVEEFEERDRDKHRRDKLVQRIARFRSSMGETGREPGTPSLTHPAPTNSIVDPKQHENTPPATAPQSPTQPDRRDPPLAIKRRLQNRGFKSI